MGQGGAEGGGAWQPLAEEYGSRFWERTSFSSTSSRNNSVGVGQNFKLSKPTPNDVLSSSADTQNLLKQSH